MEEEQDNIQKEQQAKKRFPRWFFALVIIAVLLLLFFNIAERFFVDEIVQEVVVPTFDEPEFGIEVGDDSPPWELPALNDEAVNRSDFLGEVVVLTFWSTWNNLAADQVRIFDQYFEQNGEEFFKILMINNQEDKSVVENFINRGGYSVQVLLDESGAVGGLYQIKNLPMTFFLDSNGVVRDVFVGILSQEMLEERVRPIIAP